MQSIVPRRQNRAKCSYRPLQGAKMFIPPASTGKMLIPPETFLPAANYALARNATFSTNLDTKRRVYLERHGGDVTRVNTALGTQSTISDPLVEKQIVCDTGKTFILLVSLPSLCSGIKLHTRKINFFFPSCTIYYFAYLIGFCYAYTYPIEMN